jgi:hypothetical protein
MLESVGRAYCTPASIEIDFDRYTPNRTCAPGAVPMRESAVKSVNEPVPVLTLRVSSASRLPMSNPPRATAPPLISTDPRRGVSDPIQICASASTGQAASRTSTAIIARQPRTGANGGAVTSARP